MSEAQTPPPPPPAAPPPPSYNPPPPGGGGSGPRLPWEEKDQLGIPNALIETIKLIVTDPKDAFSRLRPDGDFVNPLIFGVIVYVVGAIFSQIWGLLFGNALLQMIPSEYGDFGAFGAGAGSAAINIIFSPVYGLIGIFIGAGILHLVAMLVSALAESKFGFEGSLKVVCYASVVQLANVVPVIGPLVGLVGAIILWTVGIQKVHNTTQNKALMVVLIPIALCCVCAILGVVLFGAAIAGIAAGANG